MFGLFKKNTAKAVDPEAVSLFVRMSSDQAGDAESAELIKWAENDPDKLDDMELLSQVWEEAGEAKLDPAIFFEDQTSSQGWWRKLIAPFEAGWQAPLAGAMAMMLLVVVGVTSMTEVSNSPLSYATLRGDIETVRLTDGSDLHMNGLSRVEVAFNEQERRINMIEGEVYFDVSPDAERAFIVDVAGIEVKAIGTAFDIEVGANAVTVLVTEGVVSVGQGDFQQNYTAGNKVEIQLVDEGIINVTKLVLSNFEDAVTWRNGILNFSGETLSVALERINRQSKKPIVLIDPVLSDLQIFGSFHRGNIASFISAIEALYPVRVVESHYRVALYNKEDKRGNTGGTKNDNT